MATCPATFPGPHEATWAAALLLVTQHQIADASLSPVSEELISVRQVTNFPSPRTTTSSQLTFASASSWRTDTDHETLTLLVTKGVLEVHLKEGAARIERHALLLTGPVRGPLAPGMAVQLSAGDSLVVVRGYLLSVTNRNDAPASAMIHRFQQD